MNYRGNVRRPLPLIAILVAAFAVRLAFALLVESGTRQFFVYDASFYDVAAREIVRGHGYVWYDEGPTAFHPPGYPFLLAAAYGIFGDDLLVAKLLNVFLGTIACWFTYAIGARAYGERVGLLAAALFGLCPGHVFYTSTTMSEVAFTCMLTGAVYAFVRWSDGAHSRASLRSLALGALVSGAMLLRGVAVLFLLVFVAGWLLGDLGWRVVVKRTAWAALGLLAVLAPWIVRNQIVMGSPVLVSTGGSRVVFNAHSPVAVEDRRFVKVFREEMFRPYSDLPRPQREVATSKAVLRFAVRYMLTHPLQELQLIPRRLYQLYEHDHWAFAVLGRIHDDPDPWKRWREVMDPVWQTRWRHVADGYFYALLSLALVGVWFSISASRSSLWVVPLTFAYFNVAHGILFPASTRYHAPMIPFLALLAAIAIVRLSGSALERRPDTAAAPRPTS